MYRLASSLDKIVILRSLGQDLKGGVHGSAHVYESKYFFAFASYDPSLLN